jgi:AraC-like DNA-binding protein
MTIPLDQSLLRHRLERSGPRGRTATLVLDQLLDRVENVPELCELAAALAIPARTLSRRLAEEGTGYLELTTEVRMIAAEALLSESSLSLTHIAEVLGYSEPSCFGRAFARWKSITPGKYRECGDR